MRHLQRLLLVAALALLALSAAACSDGGGASGSRTVASDAPPVPQGDTLAVAPGGTDAGRCTPDAPCASLGYAAGVAAPGDLVQMAGGRYPFQSIPAGTGGVDGTPVIYAPAPGARVVIAELEISGAHLEMRDLTVTRSWYVLPGADHVVMRNIDTGRMLISSATHVSVIGGDIGPSPSEASAVKVYDEGFPRPSDITIDGAYFHDFTRGEDEHTECLQAWSVDRLVVKNSRFRTCSVFAISLDRLHDATGARDVLIENNFFDCAGTTGDCTYNVAWGWADHITLRHNSFAGRTFTPFDAEGSEFHDIEIVGNVGPDPGINCDVAQERFAYNVWNGRACDPSDLSAPEGYVDAAAGDLHLADGAAAIGHGPPEGGPARDIDGEPRPQGAPDAGADERP